MTTWRPLPAWPHPSRPQRSSQFRAAWDITVRHLEYQVEMMGGRDLLIGIVADADQWRLSGTLRANARTNHPGAEVSFEADGRRLIFFTDAYPSVAANLRAIGLGLDALRAVDRYGITSTGEQYAGFAAITAGGPDPLRGKMLVERAGGVTAALKAHHPDHGGKASDFADVQAFREAASE